MVTTICIVRHGQTNRNKERIIQGRTNLKLNNEGRKQASLTAKYFINHNLYFDIIGSSPLDRAIETADIIKNELGYKKDIIIFPEVIEREFGEADGANINDDIYSKIINDECIGMEKSYEIQNRMINGIKKIAKEYEGKHILIVSHSHAIKGLLTGIDGSRTFLDSLTNCAINFFTVSNDEIKIEKVNINAIY